MRFLVSSLFMAFLCSCNSGREDSQLISRSVMPAFEQQFQNVNTFETHAYDSLLNKIAEIRNIPYTHLEFGKDGELKRTDFHCGDDLFWKIVAKGRAIVPALIHKVLDSSKSNVKIQCKDEYMSKGAIAFILLDHIISVPCAVTFETQWCTMTLNCTYGYPGGVLEMVTEAATYSHQHLLDWHNKYRNKFKAAAIPERSTCQQKFGVDSTWTYD